MYTDDEGESAVRLARAVIEEAIAGTKAALPQVTERFNQKSGAFVTIETYPARRLRGCIGIPIPVLPLKDALMQSARDAATGDPRFRALAKEELQKVVIDVSLMTPPELIKVEKLRDLPKHVKIGRDGLIVERAPFRGLLLPQVATEHRMTPEVFLSETCMKAGLPPDAWLVQGTKIFKFGAEVFGELTPGGKVERKVLG